MKSSKPISEALIDSVISELPDNLSRGFGKQSWGWSLAVDVKLKNPQEIALSGSYGISWEFAEVSAKAFKSILEKRGFQISQTQN